jgi:dihydrofolate synthase/folylpolyglutamate synthase
VERLLAALGHPEHRLPPVIHVAGTNGKGSTVAALRAVMEAAGYRVHVYTSPHLVRFNERIRVAGTLIDEDALIAVLEECERVNAGASITYFEITTAAAFLTFARTPADATLLEVGLGGRLDTTNVVAHPAATVITPVSLDHQHMLGDTVGAIAGEKAGILKPGVVGVIGPQPPEATQSIERRAREVGAPLYRNGIDWNAVATAEGLRFEGRRWRLDLPPPSLVGPHQIDNAGAAIACLEGLDGFDIDAQALGRGLRSIEWPARLQRLLRGPLVESAGAHELWLDGGHNEAGGMALAAQARLWADRPLHLVFGMLKTHDARGFLEHLAPHAASLATIAIPGEANSRSAEDSAEAGHAAGLVATAYTSIAAAVEAAVAHRPPGRILICGSLYLAGRVLAENG